MYPSTIYTQLLTGGGGGAGNRAGGGGGIDICGRIGIGGRGGIPIGLRGIPIGGGGPLIPIGGGGPLMPPSIIGGGGARMPSMCGGLIPGIGGGGRVRLAPRGPIMSLSS